MLMDESDSRCAVPRYFPVYDTPTPGNNVLGKIFPKGRSGEMERLKGRERERERDNLLIYANPCCM